MADLDFVSKQARNVLAALPGTIPEIADKTGYPYEKVRAFIIELRVNGVNVAAFADPAQQTVFMVRPVNGEVDGA